MTRLSLLMQGIAVENLAEAERRIPQLVALRGELHRMLAECGQGRVCKCRVIDALASRPLRPCGGGIFREEQA